MDYTRSLYDSLESQIANSVAEGGPVPGSMGIDPNLPTEFEQSLQYAKNRMKTGAFCLQSSILNAALEGKDVAPYMERLKTFCEQVITVKPREKMRLYFPLCSAASTIGIEQCVAVFTRDGFDGTLSHLTMIDDQLDFLAWLEHNAKIQSKVFLVGGIEPDSAEYIKSLAVRIEREGYRIACKDVLGQPGTGIDLTAKRSGEVKITHYRRIRTPTGEEKIVIGFNDFR